MAQDSVLNPLGASIETAEITDGSITLPKIADGIVNASGVITSSFHDDFVGNDITDFFWSETLGTGTITENDPSASELKLHCDAGTNYCYIESVEQWQIDEWTNFELKVKFKQTTRLADDGCWVGLVTNGGTTDLILLRGCSGTQLKFSYQKDGGGVVDGTPFDFDPTSAYVYVKFVKDGTDVKCYTSTDDSTYTLRETWGAAIAPLDARMSIRARCAAIVGTAQDIWLDWVKVTAS